jgi:hypothetical protein
MDVSDRVLNFNVLVLFYFKNLFAYIYHYITHYNKTSESEYSLNRT